MGRSVLILAALTPLLNAGAAQWSDHIGHARKALLANEFELAEQELGSALKLAKRLPKSDPALGRTFSDLGGLALARGESREAVRAFKEALEALEVARGAAHADIAEALYNLGTAHLQAGSLTEAHERLWQSIQMQPKVFEGTDIRRAHPFLSLAMVSIARRQLSRARSEFRTALSRYKTAVGDESAVFKSAVQQTTALYDQMIADVLRSSGAQNPREALLREHKASILAYYGESTAAVVAAQEAVDSVSAMDSEQSPLLIRPLIDLGQAARRAKDFQRSSAAFLRAVDLSERNCGGLPQTQLVPLGQLARIYAESGDEQKALEVAEEFIELARRSYGENHGRYHRLIELSSKTLQENGHQAQARIIAALAPKATPSEGFVHTSGFDRRVRRTKAIEPTYPAAARKFGIENNITFRATVGADGQVLDVYPEVCIGYGFEEETVRAVKRFRYQPATIGGTPVASSVGGTINFVMN